MDALKNGQFSEAFDRLAQKVSEKPGEYGFAAAAAVSITLLLAVRSSKKKVRSFVPYTRKAALATGLLSVSNQVLPWRSFRGAAGPGKGL
jgi:hypothetical protein